MDVEEEEEVVVEMKEIEEEEDVVEDVDVGEGQGGRSHSSVWSSSPTQSAPPFRASCRTLLVLVLVPPPQLLEHSDHTE